MHAKLVLGILSIVPAMLAYFWYFRDMFAGKTKPHAFSWLIWGILAGNGYFAQVRAHAGVGAWVTGLTAAACLIIFGFALFRGYTKPTLLDKALLSLALVAMALLLVVDSPLIGLCITLFATTLGFSMTLRKAYHKPQEETMRSFVLNSAKFLPAIFALQTISFLTVAFPLTALFGNASVAATIFVRRKKIRP